MPSRRRPSARTVTNPGSDRPPLRRLDRRANAADEPGRQQPGHHGQDDGQRHVGDVGLAGLPGRQLGDEHARGDGEAARARRPGPPDAGWSVASGPPAGTTGCRAAPGPRPGRRPSAVARVTRPAAAQASAGSGSGSPGTSHHRTSTAASAMPAATPSGTATSSRAIGSTSPSAHSRRSVTPRREARASSGMRSSLAAVSRRSRRASATSTRERTAGAMDVRAVSSWERTSASSAGRSPRASPTRVGPLDLHRIAGCRRGR